MFLRISSALDTYSLPEWDFLCQALSVQIYAEQSEGENEKQRGETIILKSEYY